ncbi:MAG: hypothetical protein KY393_04255 [Actinobacteria bacterium]|nr:hypothetical protein [Actinomycetota bacterium]
MGLWFRKTRYFTALVGLGFQVALVVLFSNGLIHFLRLGVFALLTLLLYLAFFSEDEVFGSGDGRRSEKRAFSKARAPT